MFPSGARNTAVVLEEKTIVANGIGEQTDVWLPSSIVLWAQVDAVTGRESYVADQIRSIVSLRVQIPLPCPPIDETMRLRADGALLSIEAVLPHPDRDRVILLCSKGANRG